MGTQNTRLLIFLRTGIGKFKKINVHKIFVHDYYFCY